MTHSNSPHPMPARHTRSAARAVRARGFSLVELMIALVLGLIVIGSVIGVFIANRQSYNSNKGLGEVQDEARTAFEFMARDIRGAGLTGCGNSYGGIIRVTNLLNNGSAVSATPDWWADWNNVIQGYDGSSGSTHHPDPAVTTGAATAERDDSSSSIELIGASGTGYSVKTNNSTAATPNFILNNAPSNLQTNDILVVCDPDHAVIFQATNYTSSTLTLEYAKSASTTSGNCSTDLAYPTNCAGTSGGYTYNANAQLALLSAADWYIGTNPAGGKSLYRKGLSAGAIQAQEMVRNVTAMTISYLQSGNTDFVTASNVTNWGNVTAIRVELTLQGSSQNAGTNNQPISRTMTNTITLYNRVD